jgi:hypothetical protein
MVAAGRVPSERRVGVAVSLGSDDTTTGFDPFRRAAFGAGPPSAFTAERT